MDIVERIKNKCIEKGTNIAALEKNLSIGNGVIRRWNERKPGAEQVYKIAICLNTTVEYLLTGKEAADLTPEEQQLVELYRSSSSAGQKIILNNAQTTSETLPREQKSSISKIG